MASSVGIDEQRCESIAAFVWQLETVDRLGRWWSGRRSRKAETLRGFAEVGKPVVIEEIFPLKCSANELAPFIDESMKHATGWIGFYRGKTSNEYRPAKTIRDAIVLSWLELFQEKRKLILGTPNQPDPKRESKE